MDQTLDHFKRALAVYQRDPVAWTMLYGALILLSLVTMGLGCVLVPNTLRATRDALREDRAPDITALFRFDDIVEDAIAAGGFVVVMMVVSSFLGPLSVAVSVVLGLAPAIVTEDRVGGLDALQGSVEYLQANPNAVVAHWLITMLITTPLACCFFPLFVVVPIAGIAEWLFYEAHREAILKLPAPET